jgi:hypothetical protein
MHHYYKKQELNVAVRRVNVVALEARVWIKNLRYELSVDQRKSDDFRRIGHHLQSVIVFHPEGILTKRIFVRSDTTA